MLQEFMKEHPQVKQIKWTQYTPYFNDGDACEFSVNCIGFYFEGDDIEEPDYDFELYRYDNFEKKEVCSFETFRACKDLEKELQEASAELETIFGDHVEVTVKADGVEVEEYDHD
jgi:hypothetical protein